MCVQYVLRCCQVNSLIDKIVARGGNRGAHIDWDVFEQELQLLNTDMVHNRHPGEKLLTPEERDEEAEHGTEAEKYFLTKARPGKYRGTDGFWVPTRRGVEVERQEAVGSALKEKLKKDESMPDFEELLPNYAGAELARIKGGATSSGSSAAVAGGQEDPPAAPAAKAAEAPPSASGGAVKSQQKDVPPPSLAAKGSRKKDPAAKAEAKPKGTTKAKAAPKGRPPKDPCVLIDSLEVQFKAASQDNTVFFGTEAKTKLKALRDIRTSLLARVAANTEVHANQAYESRRKQLDYIIAMVDVGVTSTFSSNAFVELHDMHQTSANLAPVVTLPVPDFLKWRRHSYDIFHTKHTEVWLRKVSSEELRKMAAPGVEMEQTKFLAQRVLALVKLPKMQEVLDSLREVFSPESAELFSFEAELTEVAASVVMLVSYDSYEDLEERKELLEDAIQLADEKAKHPLMISLRATPRGRDVVDRAKAHLVLVEESLKRRDKLTKSLEKFTEATNQGLEKFTAERVFDVEKFLYVADALSVVVKDYDATKDSLPAAQMKVEAEPLQIPFVSLMSTTYNICLEHLGPLLCKEVGCITIFQECEVSRV